MGGGWAEFEADALGGADVVVPPLAAFGGDFELAEAEAGEVGLGPVVGGLEDGIAEAGGPGLLAGEVEDAVAVSGEKRRAGWAWAARMHSANRRRAIDFRIARGKAECLPPVVG